ncbi:MAG: gluconate 2-dehydrogenase subunit 3 family protein [Bacteroidetes bacterium]|jgi:hypothetical protein|nr:gluconate 2-dehydrogenase subunit 3 family protein [Bacteroidota bacterium]
MNRREALTRIAFLTGGALSFSTVAGVMSGCQAPEADGWTPETLSADAAERLRLLADTIIPSTDTPGAGDVGVERFIDQMLTYWMVPDERAHFVDGLEEADAMARSSFEHGISGLTSEERTTLMQQLVDAANGQLPQTVVVEMDAAWATYSAPTEVVEGTRQPSELEVTLMPFFYKLKELTMVGYYTSEPGATEELQYVHVPGRYDGCEPLEAIGRTWAV